jgi:hypothetical protein
MEEIVSARLSGNLKEICRTGFLAWRRKPGTVAAGARKNTGRKLHCSSAAEGGAARIPLRPTLEFSLPVSPEKAKGVNLPKE